MKAIILVLCGLIAFSSAAGLLKHKSHAGTHTRVQLRQVNVDDLSAEVRESLEFGKNKVVAAAQKAGKVDAEDIWTIQNVRTATEELNGKRAVNHIFEVVLTDNNDSILTATFSVNYVPFSDYRSLNSFQYKVKNSRTAPLPAPTGEWQDVDLEQDDYANALVEETVNTVVQRGSNEGKIPDGQYWAAEASVQSQPMTTGTNYVGSVFLYNGRTVELTVDFTVLDEGNGKRTTNSSFVADRIPVGSPVGHGVTVHWFGETFTQVA